MGIAKRRQLLYKKKVKRKKRRLRLVKKGKNPDEHFKSGIYIGRG